MINIIVAVARNNAIGRGGDLLYPISADLKRFKRLTMGHPIIMGRKTFESFPNGPLPGRRNIVVTRNSNYDVDGIEKAGSLQDGIEKAGNSEEIFIIGGGEIYRQAIDMADRLHLTVIETEPEDADTFFPAIDPEKWHVTQESDPETDPRSGVTYRFVTMDRT